MSANLTLSVIIATMETVAIERAMIGKNGYIGTRNGRDSPGSFFLKTITAIIAKMYNKMAPKQAIVIISPVLPVYNAVIPTIIFNNNALAGVLNFG